jgi:hypothetical protein
MYPGPRPAVIVVMGGPRPVAYAAAIYVRAVTTGQLVNNAPLSRTEQGRNTFGTCFGETGLKIWPDVFRHDNCEQKKPVLLCKMSPASHFFLFEKGKKNIINEICSQLS